MYRCIDDIRYSTYIKREDIDIHYIHYIHIQIHIYR